MSDTTETPQPTTSTSPSKADTQTQKQATISVLNKFLETDGLLYGNSVKAILAYATNVLAARDALKPKSIPLLHFNPWNDFQAKCKGKSAVSKCIAIAEHPAINDIKNVKYLPASLSSIYELTSLSVEEFNHAAKIGTISAAMTRHEARAIAGKNPHPNGTLKRFDKGVVNGEGVESLTNLRNAAETIASELNDANHEDHLAAAKATEDICKVLGSFTPNRDEDGAAGENGDADEDGDVDAEESTNAAGTKPENKIVIIDTEVKQRYPEKALGKARKELLDVLKANGLTGVGIRLVIGTSTRPGADRSVPQPPSSEDHRRSLSAAS
jgi:hypothetical protein